MEQSNQPSMLSIDYDGRRFRTVRNTDNGEVNEETVFYYFQQGRNTYLIHSDNQGAVAKWLDIV